VIDWNNIASCAQKRADEKTFNWDEESSPLGELETREMARFMSYRSALLTAFLRNS
jgi:hypothetical protein